MVIYQYPNDDDLLLAFAPLDETGRGVFPTYKEYLDHLFIIWQQLDSPEYIRLSVYMD